MQWVTKANKDDQDREQDVPGQAAHGLCKASSAELEFSEEDEQYVSDQVSVGEPAPTAPPVPPVLPMPKPGGLWRVKTKAEIFFVSVQGLIMFLAQKPLAARQHKHVKVTIEAHMSHLFFLYKSSDPALGVSSWVTAQPVTSVKHIKDLTSVFFCDDSLTQVSILFGTQQNKTTVDLLWLCKVYLLGFLT